MNEDTQQPSLFDELGETQFPAGTTANTPTTITSLTSHIVALFERDDLLRDVWVTGEVSNWKQAASGHAYFSMKDSGATINAVMWRRSASQHSWLPNNGDQILAHGYVSIYPERGAYQLYVNRIQPAGKGQLYAQFERLKEQLGAAGLFDAERKRPLPAKVQRVGVITSPDAAAFRDILRVLSARWPSIDVILFPTLVQGSEAPRQVVHALSIANLYCMENEPLDLIILARGGGSIEDLWSFNDQRVAYAMVESVLPVVTGIGHETDFTIADFVADMRTPTPSAAAVAITPDRDEALAWVQGARDAIQFHITSRIRSAAEQLEGQKRRLMYLHPARQVDLRRQQLDDKIRRLQSQMAYQLERAKERTQSNQLHLGALNPANVLKRGYSIVQKESGEVVATPDAARQGETLVVQSAGGSYLVQRQDSA
ncbi:MAG: exodeoxyribonuclease VII large subunit [Chloroflexota bacterium]